MSSRQRVIVGMSGGVDSSTAAALLQQQGHEVHGLFMFNWEEQDDLAYCTAAEDFQDAQQVCKLLGIPLHRADFAKQYRDAVFEQFLAGLRSGVTPNPDVLCNREIKFGQFHDYALRLGASRVATGHYARLVHNNGQTQLHRASDRNKDQSYFLHAVDENALQRSVFPLGEMTKPQVRALARQLGLPNFRKRDSTGICFIGERPFREFLGAFLEPRPGPIVTTSGQRLGEHAGLHFYTLGQRQGLGIGGVAGAADAPWYVVAKIHREDTLVVAQQHDHPLLMSDWLTAASMHWINDDPQAPFNASVATRYRQQPAAARIFPGKTSQQPCRIEFAQPQWAVTPGQFAVVYDGDRCLGGGAIVASGNACLQESAAV